MTRASARLEHPDRPLSPEERDVVRFLLASAGIDVPLDDGCRVRTMADGGMGSISFLYPGDDQPGPLRSVIDATYTDSDGVSVSIELTVYANGNIHELDFWKVDFSPLRRYPQPADIKLKVGRLA